jgi:hypothetical protein
MNKDDELLQEHATKSAHLVPDHIWKLTQHYHDLLELKRHWESAGTTCPPAFNKELQRAHEALLSTLEEEWGQGGVYHKPGVV